MKFKKYTTKSLRFQILIRSFLILITLLTIVEISQYITMKKYLYGSKEQLLDSRFHNVDIIDIYNLKSREDLLNSAEDISKEMIDTDTSIGVIDNKGEIIYKQLRPEGFGEPFKKSNFNENKGLNVPELSKDEYIKLLNQSGDLKGYKLIKDREGYLQIVIWRKLGDLNSPTGIIQLSTRAKPIQDILSKQVYAYIFASFGVLILGFIIGTAVIKYTLKPLENMTDTIEKIDVGQLDIRLPENNNQIEINRLSKSFNNMISDIQNSFENEERIKNKMRQFVSDASHELRTPLTSIHGFVEVLLRGAAKNENQLNLALNNILIESERLTKLVNDLLMLNRLDQQVKPEMKKEDLNQIIRDIYPSLEILAGERNIILNLSSEVEVLCNKNGIKQIIINLFQNAVKYTNEEKGIITIETYKKDKLILLKITDNGTGIKEEYKDEIFDRFFRGESHRARKYGGYGLGLSIVKSIVESHGGEIRVESKIGEGSSFLVFFRDSSK